MSEPLFSDAVALLRPIIMQRLRAHLGRDVPVSSRRPADLPPEFLRIIQTGGYRKNRVTVSRTFAIEAWASTSGQAVQLAEATYSIVHSLENSVIDGVQVGLVEDFALPADLPDPDTEHSRFTFTTALDLSYATLI